MYLKKVRGIEPEILITYKMLNKQYHLFILEIAFSQLYNLVVRHKPQADCELSLNSHVDIMNLSIRKRFCLSL